MKTAKVVTAATATKMTFDFDTLNLWKAHIRAMERVSYFVKPLFLKIYFPMSFVCLRIRC